MVLTVWATLVAGVDGAAWHFLGWAYVLVGWAGWTSGKLPSILSGLYLMAGAAALVVYQWPEPMEGMAGLFAMVVSIGLGVLLLRRRADGG